MPLRIDARFESAFPLRLSAGTGLIAVADWRSSCLRRFDPRDGQLNSVAEIGNVPGAGRVAVLGEAALFWTGERLWRVTASSRESIDCPFDANGSVEVCVSGDGTPWLSWQHGDRVELHTVVEGATRYVATRDADEVHELIPCGGGGVHWGVGALTEMEWVAWPHSPHVVSFRDGSLVGDVWAAGAWRAVVLEANGDVSIRSSDDSVLMRSPPETDEMAMHGKGVAGACSVSGTRVFVLSSAGRVCEWGLAQDVLVPSDVFAEGIWGAASSNTVATVLGKQVSLCAAIDAASSYRAPGR